VSPKEQPIAGTRGGAASPVAAPIQESRRSSLEMSFGAFDEGETSDNRHKVS
jgi:hypothetical protein